MVQKMLEKSHGRKGHGSRFFRLELQVQLGMLTFLGLERAGRAVELDLTEPVCLERRYVIQLLFLLA